MITAIAAHALKKSYGSVRALDGLSLEVQQGEIFGLLGANGAGKTTFIKTLIGMLRLDEGALQVMGYDPRREAHAIRRQTGYMPQFPALYDDLSARENIRFFGQPHRLANLNQRIDEVLAFVDLLERANSPIHAFSGGMKQRASLACALVHRPRLLLLDEPTTGIDPKLRHSFWSHFRELTEQGTTLVISTHQMDEALHCDRIAVMRAGQVLACDTPLGLLARGRTTVTIRRGGEVFRETIANAPDALPSLLRRFGLDSAVTQIDLREETLENVVLSLISAQRNEIT